MNRAGDEFKTTDLGDAPLDRRADTMLGQGVRFAKDARTCVMDAFDPTNRAGTSMQLTIPILFCFDDNYTIPAGVAFHSLLLHADPAYRYHLHVAHSGLSRKSQTLLSQTVQPFRNAQISFHDQGDRYDQLFATTGSQGHYSKEMYFKFLAPQILHGEAKAIISDVDVVFLGDVARDYLEFKVDANNLVAGSPGLVRRGSWADRNTESYKKDFSDEEIKKLTVGAGYYIFNLQQMRHEGHLAQFTEFAHANSRRIRQPEQDVISLICHPRISILPADAMVCTYSYEFYADASTHAQDLIFDASAVSSALDRPIQLHYAGREKPWTHPACPKGDIWFKYLAQTPLLAEYLLKMEQKYRIANHKVIASMKLPFSRRRFILTKAKS